MLLGNLLLASFTSFFPSFRLPPPPQQPANTCDQCHEHDRHVRMYTRSPTSSQSSVRLLHFLSVEKSYLFLPNKLCVMLFFLLLDAFNCWNYALFRLKRAKLSWSPFRKFQMEISSKQNSLSRLWLPVSSLPSIIVYH